MNSGDIRAQDSTSVLSQVALNPIGTSLVWRYVRESWDVLLDRSVVFTHSTPTLVIFLGLMHFLFLKAARQCSNNSYLFHDKLIQSIFIYINYPCGTLHFEVSMVKKKWFLKSTQ